MQSDRRAIARRTPSRARRRAGECERVSWLTPGWDDWSGYEQMFRRGADRGPGNHTRLVHAGFDPVAHAAGENRAEPSQVGGGERCRIVLRVDRFQLALEDVRVERTAGDEP